jgi:hypothetical protein
VSRRRAIVRAVLSFVAAIVTVGALTLIAGAHDTDFNDPNDTRGKLDVSRVRLAHQPAPPIWTIVTFQEWGIREMWDRGYLMVLIDTRMDPAPEHYLLVRSDVFALEGTLWRIRSVGLRRLAFGPTRPFYRWWVKTIVTGDLCPQTCQDRAPNGGRVLNWRPGMSPTPSPSPTSSPSPSP